MCQNRRRGVVLCRKGCRTHNLSAITRSSNGLHVSPCRINSSPSLGNMFLGFVMTSESSHSPKFGLDLS